MVKDGNGVSRREPQFQNQTIQNNKSWSPSWEFVNIHFGRNQTTGNGISEEMVIVTKYKLPLSRIRVLVIQIRCMWHKMTRQPARQEKQRYFSEAPRSCWENQETLLNCEQCVLKNLIINYVENVGYSSLFKDFYMMQQCKLYFLNGVILVQRITFGKTELQIICFTFQN